LSEPEFTEFWEFSELFKPPTTEVRMSRLKHILHMASIVLATAFTFSCSSDSDESNSPEINNNSSSSVLYCHDYTFRGNTLCSTINGINVIDSQDCRSLGGEIREEACNATGSCERDGRCMENSIRSSCKAFSGIFTFNGKCNTSRYPYCEYDYDGCYKIGGAHIKTKDDCDDGSLFMSYAFCQELEIPIYDGLDNSSSSILAQSSSSSSVWNHPWNPNIDYGELVDERDGKVYRTVVIGEQTWMAQNLNYYVRTTNSIGCYNNDPENCKKYGSLYDWFDAMAITTTASIAPNPYLHRGICPLGWHIPADPEWNLLFRYVDDESTNNNWNNYSTAGKYLKATNGWDDGEDIGGNGEDTHGFTALPGGYANDRLLGGLISKDIGDHGYWWSSSKIEYSITLYRMSYYSDGVDTYMTGSFMRSVRCLKDY
jgi:uncharacterized protein (TIGR02145 family)